MPRTITPSFITELPLKVDSAQDKELKARFQAARQLYNACLSEAMTRLNLVRNSEAYQAAKKIPRANKKQRSDAFKKASEAYRYSEYDLHSFAAIVSKQSRWIDDKIDSRIVQTIATRAFKASQRVLLGKARRVRFKTAGQFKSIENKTNQCGLRWKDDRVVWGKDFTIQPIIDWTNPVIKHGLSSPVKYIRLVRRELNGKKRWFVQLINEGLPYPKPQNFVDVGLVGLDLNVSNVAFVGDLKAGLLPFAEHVPTYERSIRNLQRRMERSRRATNPDNYEPDFKAKRGNRVVKKKGKIKKGARQRVKSVQYQTAAAKKRELERRKAAYAKSQNRRLVNEILRHGNCIRTEKVSVKGWQKRYGKAISAKSPGFFQSELKRKAESAGGKFETFSTRNTALSQMHLTGERIQKPLGQRVHFDATGKTMQRDLFSAFLSRHVYQGEFSVQDAVYEYPGLEPVLIEAWKTYHQQSARRVSDAESRMTDTSFERISMKARKVNQIGGRQCSGPKVSPNSWPESPRL